MPKRLLLADDSVVIQKLVGLSFANEDVELVTTDNGDDALEEALRHKPDVVLVDVVMPGRNGYEVCAAIKQRPELQETPVLLLTGTFEAFDEERARQVGSDGHITKPFEAQALVDRVKELFDAAPSGAAPAAPAASQDDAVFDFFDDAAAQDEPAAEASANDEAVTSWAPPLEDGLEMDASAEPGAAGESADDAFAIGSDTLSPLDEDDLMAAASDLDDDLALADEAEALAPLPSERRPSALSDDQESPTVTNLDFGDAVASPFAPLAPSGPADLDAELTPPPLPSATAEESLETGPGASGSLTTVIMSDGDSSSDGVAFGSMPPIEAPATGEPPPATSGVDDFFGDSPAVPDAAADDVDDFDFASDSLPDLAPAEPVLQAAPGASGYDISSSDLGDPFARPIAPAEETPFASDEAVAFPDYDSEDAVVEAATDTARDAAAPLGGDAAAPFFETHEDAVPGPLESGSGGTPDLSPVMRDRIHETIERVAWEAFADLSETIVKQAIERVEAIAWEVVPQMAEALIKEEIRRIKGDDEE